VNFAILGASVGVQPARRGLGDLSELSYSVVGDSPIETRIAKLLRGVTLSLHDPQAVARVRRVIGKCRPTDVLCRLGAGLYDLRRAIRYRLDDENLDRYAPYMVSIGLGYGDCGSMAVAKMTHDIVCGVVAGPTTIAQPDPKTGVVGWNHVYNYAIVNGRRVTADVSERAVPLGWEPQRWRIKDRRDWIYDSAAWEAWFSRGAPEDDLPDVTGRYRQ